MAQLFGAGAPAGSHFQHQVEDFAAHILDAALTIGDRTRIDVHVGGHGAVGVAVGGDLDDGNGGEADGAAASGGEGDEVATAGGEAGEGDRIVPRRIHEREARGGDPFGVVVDFHERRG